MLPFDEAGSDPAVVLVHAGIADRTMWSEHLDPLAEAGYRALAFDLPGFGEAPVGPGGHAPWNDVLRAIAELGIDRAAIVGNSFGGAVALRAAVVAPAAVWALSLISAPAPGLEPSEQLQAAWEAEETALDHGDINAAVKAVVDAWTLPDAPQKLRDRIAVMQGNALALQADAEGVVEAPDPLQDLESLGVLEIPTLVAWGEHDMSDFEQSAYVLSRAMPNARRERIRDAGHLAPLETPEAFRHLVVAFLEETRAKGEG